MSNQQSVSPFIAEYIGGPFDGQQCELLYPTIGRKITLSSIADDDKVISVREVEYILCAGRRLVFCRYTGFHHECQK